MFSRIFRNLSFIFLGSRPLPSKLKLMAWYLYLTSKYLLLYRVLYPGKKVPVQSQRMFNYKVKFCDYWRFIYLFEHIFIQEEYFFKTKSAAPRILDCGSNVGMSILYFKNLYPESCVAGFEPDPTAYEILKHNIEENRLNNVELHNLALFSKEGEIDFFIGAEDPASLLMSVVPDRIKGNAIKVKTVPLSRFIDQPVDLLKIDIEGAEIDVLSELFEKGRLKMVEAMIIEYHHYLQPGISRLAPLLKILEDAGFFYQLYSPEPVQCEDQGRFQDIMIYARRKN